MLIELSRVSRNFQTIPHFHSTTLHKMLFFKGMLCFKKKYESGGDDILI